MALFATLSHPPAGCSAGLQRPSAHTLAWQWWQRPLLAHLALQLADGSGQLDLRSLGQRGEQVGAQVLLALLLVLELRRRKELEMSRLPGCGPFKLRACLRCYLALQLRDLLDVQRLRGLSQLVVLRAAGLLLGSVLVLYLGGMSVRSG